MLHLTNKCLLILLLMCGLCVSPAQADEKIQFGRVQWLSSPQAVYAVVKQDFDVALTDRLVVQGEDVTDGLDGGPQDLKLRFAYVHLFDKPWTAVFYFWQDELVKVKILHVWECSNYDTQYSVWKGIVGKYEAKYGAGNRLEFASENEHITHAEYMAYKEFDPKWLLRDSTGVGVVVSLKFTYLIGMVSATYQHPRFEEYLVWHEKVESEKF